MAWSVQAAAAGLGPGDAGATMGQPLNFAVAVRLDPGETLSPECVAAEVVVGDRRLPPPLVRALIEMTSATTARVRVQTQVSIDEPVVQVQLGVGCSNRIARSYVVLADPPGTAFVQPPAPPALVQAASLPPAVAPEPAAAVPRAAAVEPARGMTTSPPALTPEQIRARDERNARLREQRLARQRAAREARAARQRAEPERTAAAPRLQLDLIEPAPNRGVGAPPSEALARAMTALAEAASAAQAAASAASASASRVAALEQELAQLRIEGKTSRDLVSALRDQLIEARSSSRWTTPLTLASLLLAALAAWLAWRLGRVQAAQRQQWRQAAAGFGSNGPATSVSGIGGFDAPSTRSRSAPGPFLGPEARSTVIASPESPLVPATVALPKAASAAARANRAWPPPAPPVAWPAPPTTLSPDVAPETVPGLHPDVQRAAQSAGSPLFEPDTQPEPAPQRTNILPVGGRSDETSPRDVSIEELIDLEQQAEFFLVLGQDEAAVDLLVEHLRTTGGGSPLPYLKLLEIHRRHGDHEAYERTRQRFNHRFNAYAPEWGVDMTTGRSLEDYVGVIPRLQQVWARPLDAMAELEALLFRKSRGELFDLPAYREVLFLYALARDLLDRSAVDTGSVDLLLPIRDLEDEGPGDVNGSAPPLELEHDAFKDTMPPEDSLPTAPLDFDVTNSDRATSVFQLLDDEKRPRDPRK
ncbi:MAG: FimV family protein [Betaproteobacteria bacterium]